MALTLTCCSVGFWIDHSCAGPFRTDREVASVYLLDHLTMMRASPKRPSSSEKKNQRRDVWKGRLQRRKEAAKANAAISSNTRGHKNEWTPVSIGYVEELEKRRQAAAIPKPKIRGTASTSDDDSVSSSTLSQRCEQSILNALSSEINRNFMKKNETTAFSVLKSMDKCEPCSKVAKLHGFLLQQDIEELREETNYSERELFALFIRFKALTTMSSTNIGIDDETFRKGIPLLSVEDSLFVTRVFQVLDEDGSGIIEWDEFLEAMSSLEKGTREQRTSFLFRVYDTDKDGGISGAELQKFFLSSLMVTINENIREVTEYFVDKVFKTIGQGKEGDTVLTAAQVQEYVANHPEVVDVYSLFGRSMTTERNLADSKSRNSEEGAVRALARHMFYEDCYK